MITIEKTLDKLESAIANAKDWEREKTLRTFQSGFCYALGILAFEEQQNKRKNKNE